MSVVEQNIILSRKRNNTLPTAGYLYIFPCSVLHAYTCVYTCYCCGPQEVEQPVVHNEQLSAGSLGYKAQLKSLSDSGRLMLVVKKNAGTKTVSVCIS